MSALTASLQHHRRDDSKIDNPSASSSAAGSSASLSLPTTSSSTSSSTSNPVTQQSGNITASATIPNTTIPSSSSSSASSYKIPYLSQTEVQELADLYANALLQPSEHINTSNNTNTDTNLMGFLICNHDGEILRSYGSMEEAENNQQIASIGYNILLNIQSFIHDNQMYRNESGSSQLNGVDAEGVEKMCITFKRQTYIITHTSHLIIIAQQSDGKG